jgi:hypothetical protein
MSERDDLLETLRKHRSFLRYTCRDLSDEQANQRTTVSELTLAGLIKHVAATENRWTNFIRRGPEAFGTWDESQVSEYSMQFRMLEGETLAGILDDYELVGQATDELVVSLSDLDASQPLPQAPWFEPGARWSARRVFLHILAEVAQHAGHADIIRESLDGAKTMG